MTTAGRLGARILEQGSPLWNRRFSGDVAPALLTGLSAHAIMRPRSLAPAGAGMLLGAMADIDADYIEAPLVVDDADLKHAA